MSNPPKSVTIKLGDKSIKADRDADVCVVYMHTVGPTEALHEAPMIVIIDDIEPLTIEPGGSMIRAGLLADHIEAAAKLAEETAKRGKLGPMLARVLDAGGITVYSKAEEALNGSAKAILDMIGVTRHAHTLEMWLATERARDTKRMRIIEGLEKRLRQYGNHTTAALSLEGLGLGGAEMRAAG